MQLSFFQGTDQGYHLLHQFPDTGEDLPGLLDREKALAH